MKLCGLKYSIGMPMPAARSRRDSRVLDVRGAAQMSSFSVVSDAGSKRS